MVDIKIPLTGEENFATMGMDTERGFGAPARVFHRMDFDRLRGKGEQKMDDFFSTLGRRISDTVDEFGKKAEDTLEIQKLKGDIYSLKRENSRDFADIGKKVYEHFKNAEEVGEEYLSFCEEIEKREEKIQELNRTISRIKGE